MLETSFHISGMGNAIRQLRKARGWSQARLGKEIGTTKIQVSRLERGERRLTQDWLRRLSNALDVSMAEILEERPSLVNNFVTINVKGFVQAGVWQEAVEHAEYEQQKIGLPTESWCEGMFALKVRGSSMNRLLREGEIVLCVPFSEYAGPIESGLLVVCERTAGNGLIEATIKELEIRDGEFWLWPRSDDPAYQQPIKIPPLSEWPHSDDGIDLGEVRLTAVALDALTSLRPKDRIK